MRISDEQRRDTEQRIRAAARALLAGEIPAGGSCDVTTLARQARVSRAALYRSYPNLKAEFEQQLAQSRARGCAPDPRDAQILRLKEENAVLKERLRRHEAVIAELQEFKVLALSRLTAQDEEITRLRTGHAVATRPGGTVRELPSGRVSNPARPGS